MVKKIKVVEMNTSNPEAIEEQDANMQAKDPTPTQEVAQAQEAITQDQEPAIIKEEEPKAKKPRAPRAPKAQKEKVQAPPPSDSDSIDTEEMIAVIKNHRASKKQPVQAQEPPPEPPVAQAQALPPSLGGVRTDPSLKGAKSKTKSKPKPPQEEIVEESPTKTIDKPHPRTERMNLIKERYNNLVKNAFNI